MINAINISFQIGEKQIIQDISVKIQPGEITSILGPNGAGKSTLMKILTGMENPSKGQVQLYGKPIASYSIKQLSKVRSVLAQSTSITFPFSSWEIVMMGRTPHLLDHETKQDKDIAHHVLTMLNALHLKDRQYSTLSGGEQQRIQFARVLIQIWDQKDACLFMDEPTTALDLKQQIALIEVARQVALDKGFCVCVILHDIHMAKTFSDKCILLKDGRLSAFGNSAEVLSISNINEVFDVPINFLQAQLY